MTDHKVVIVIPFHKNTLSPLEMVSLQQLKKVLPNYPMVVVKPESREMPPELTEAPFLTEAFDDKYFKDPKGYNNLVMTTEFYERFLAYDFMLIYQLDVFVFRDELQHWCNQGYDYIGAPWIHKYDYPDVVKATKSKLISYLHTRFNIMKDDLPSLMQLENKVGNGGFSLRHVRKFYDATIKMQAEIAHYFERPHHLYNEDVFWSIEVNRKRKVLNIPGYRKAMQFAIENHPERGLELNHNKLPFGCHAFDRHLDFWRPIFKGYGYDI
ncbi:DUF5672 family protein [Mucilaginibacter pedocola]|uniref:DUF5672 domain-containing protein n=1 Tax=Mucilaginibacter pedocola TaxID=1792845 RepID=A0A1S9PIA6_9SPHI|nr:DUF5672 family protein [Mucilaginibacter pedocola]OOQ60690.1 hypothetical protein BC343_24160 [Mucilaginibacter pedocola]